MTGHLLSMLPFQMIPTFVHSSCLDPCYHCSLILTTKHSLFCIHATTAVYYSYHYSVIPTSKHSTLPLHYYTYHCTIIPTTALLYLPLNTPRYHCTIIPTSKHSTLSLHYYTYLKHSTLHSHCLHRTAGYPLGGGATVNNASTHQATN